MAHTVGWGMAGAATTMLARAATRRAMHGPDGAPRLPRRAQKSHTFAMMLVFAAATGAMLALADVLQEQRKRTTQEA